MGAETARACKEFGAIHCVFPAGNAVLAATEVEKVESANWRELGMCETLWTFKVHEFGPLIVSIDAVLAFFTFIIAIVSNIENANIDTSVLLIPNITPTAIPVKAE